VLSPTAILGYLKLMLRGWLPWKAQPDADLLQLGGDFVLDETHQIVLAYRSVGPTDRPTARQLVDAVHAATSSPQTASPPATPA
jgi:hypothetical protein